ncbi:aminotransferase class I/II-fold pyridoxal phosphate-dependent enzyme [Alteribacillus sp. YIM 98480]|uniref:aminotransferase class I/II-fold pyridoxal phosphate-dependent enzyme n=1 Tax=Alteribacillus sp. YIM 98480 TaxID=2606599 RepID=UPI00131CD412|nr:aminotransferase class I/II-fold pyridoxal phosphate-dependent enzyme [Alteribacillus sp. YIM 98480]
MDQQSMPLVEALLKHAGKQPVSFHVPGHKNGSILSSGLKNIFASVLPFDQTELTNLDDLHDAEGVIASAQELAAEVYGASETLFLVGGSTSGNLAMIFAAFNQGDIVLVQRDSHKSVINGIRLAGLNPVFLFPEYDDESQLSTGVSLSTVEKAFSIYPEAKGLILTSPTYYGWTPRLEPIVKLAHTRGAAVVVDEAHGAHFTAGSMFPDSALEQGADAVVHSAHKTLPALTMGAFLHLGKNSSLSVDGLKEAASTVQSSSPSYPVMASLDGARKYLFDMKQKSGEALTNHFITIREKIQKATGLSLVTPKGILHDLLKCIVKAPEGYSGWDLQVYLEKENIFVELADHKHVLLVLPLTDKPLSNAVYKKLHSSVERMKAEVKADKSKIPFKIPSFRSKIIDTEEGKSLFHMKQWKETIEKANGKKAGTDLIPYPPGVPLFLKGEIIKGERYIYLLDWLKSGGRVQGAEYKHHDWYISIQEKDEE